LIFPIQSEKSIREICSKIKTGKSCNTVGYMGANNRKTKSREISLTIKLKSPCSKNVVSKYEKKFGGWWRGNLPFCGKLSEVLAIL